MHHPLRFGVNTIQNLDWPTMVEHCKQVDYPAIPPDKSMDRVMLERVTTGAIPVLKSKEAGIQ
jgi:hypothetical protein